MRFSVDVVGRTDGGGIQCWCCRDGRMGGTYSVGVVGMDGWGGGGGGGYSVGVVGMDG